MAAESSDVQTLVANLRGKGLSNAEVISGLENLGYSKAEARAAVGGGAAKKTAAKKKTTAPRPKAAGRAPRTAGGSKPTSTPPGPSGGSPSKVPKPGLPKIQPPDFSQVTLTPPKRLNAGDLGGFLGGLVLYALFLNFLRFGAEGPKGWMSAKFLNRPLDGMDASSSKSRRNNSAGTSAT